MTSGASGKPIRYGVVAVLLVVVGCSDSPTAPTPPTTTTPPVVTTPPAVATPPVEAPAPNPLLSDPRFDLTFYRMFVLGSHDAPALQPLRRKVQAPLFYIQTTDDTGTPVDARTLESTAAALLNTVGHLTGVFGAAGLERGTDTREGKAGWITVKWATASNTGTCGRAGTNGDIITLYPNTPNCGCDGLQIAPAAVRHELGHTLGFYHTDTRSDLMYSAVVACNQEPSQREIFHAKVAYSQPIGSLDPK